MSEIDILRRLAAAEQQLRRPIEIPSAIVAHYSTNAGQVIPDTTVTIIDFEDVLYDTHSLVTTGAAWKFTATVAGYYHVAAAAMFTATTAWAATEYTTLYLYKGGSGFRALDRQNDHTAANIFVMLAGAADVYLAATEYIDIRISQTTGGNLALYNNGTYNYVSIHKLT